MSMCRDTSVAIAHSLRLFTFIAILVFWKACFCAAEPFAWVLLPAQFADSIIVLRRELQFLVERWSGERLLFLGLHIVDNLCPFWNCDLFLAKPLVPVVILQTKNAQVRVLEATIYLSTEIVMHSFSCQLYFGRESGVPQTVQLSFQYYPFNTLK